MEGLWSSPVNRAKKIEKKSERCYRARGFCSTNSNLTGETSTHRPQRVFERTIKSGHTATSFGVHEHPLCENKFENKPGRRVIIMHVKATASPPGPPTLEKWGSI